MARKYLWKFLQPSACYLSSWVWSLLPGLATIYSSLQNGLSFATHFWAWIQPDAAFLVSQSSHFLLHVTFKWLRMWKVKVTGWFETSGLTLCVRLFPCPLDYSASLHNFCWEGLLLCHTLLKFLFWSFKMGPYILTQNKSATWHAALCPTVRCKKESATVCWVILGQSVSKTTQVLQYINQLSREEGVNALHKKSHTCRVTLDRTLLWLQDSINAAQKKGNLNRECCRLCKFSLSSVRRFLLAVSLPYPHWLQTEGLLFSNQRFIEDQLWI